MTFIQALQHLSDKECGYIYCENHPDYHVIVITKMIALELAYEVEGKILPFTIPPKEILNFKWHTHQ